MRSSLNCSMIKGVNYTPSYACNPISFWRDYEPETVARELGYAKKLGFNCVRVFLSYVVFENTPDEFLNRVDHLVQTAKANGIDTMLVVFDGCFSREEPVIDWDKNEWIPNPGCMNLEEHFWPKGDHYCRSLIERFGKESAVIFWDVMNEPECTSFLTDETGEAYEKNLSVIYRFVGHYAELFSGADLLGAVTVGSMNNHGNANLERFDVMKYLDVISFHDYMHTSKIIQKNYDDALELGRRYNKPVIVSEIGCPPRGNPYDLAIEIAGRNNVGYFLWELMIGKSFWNDRHGVVYPDGSIRDTALVAALYGHFRRRTPDGICYDGNVEGLAASFVTRAEELLAGGGSFEDYSEILESITNLAESCLLVPTQVPNLASLADIKTSGDLCTARARLKEYIAFLKAACNLA